MSRLNDDAHRLSRPRANTSTFSTFWRRGRVETTFQPPAESPPLSSEALIAALTPPAVPSLNHARALAAALSGNTARPRISTIIPVASSLCFQESPPALQTAGFDILAAYWSNGDTADLTSADRFSCLSLLIDQTSSWVEEVWEPKFRALVAFTSAGTETVGMEGILLRALRNWIESAFLGLLPGSSRVENSVERQRSVETLASFHFSLVSKQDFVARLTNEDVAGMLHLYGGLADKALYAASLISPPTSATPSVRSPRPLPRHDRSSSSSSPSLPKPPADLAVELFLNYLYVRLEGIAPDHLETIVPYLFRALSWYVSPLPRLTLNAGTPQQNPLERRIVDILDTLVTGSYAASCAILLKRSLFPSPDFLKSAQITVGALRTLRASLRRTLLTRLARSYISRTTSATYTSSGAPVGIELNHDIMERAWSRDDVAVWGLSRFRATLCNATKAWMNTSHEWTLVQSSTDLETILNEVAGIVIDMVQAFDEAGEAEDPNEEDIEGVNDLLTDLVAYIPLRRDLHGAFIRLDLAQGRAPSPFLANLATLLSPNLLTTPLYDILASVVLSIAPHVTDADVAQLLVIMSERQSLSPTSPKWLEYWTVILSTPELYSSRRPLSRHASRDILQSVWEFVKDIPAYRRPMGSLLYTVWRHHVIANQQEHSSDLPWRILADELVLRISGDGIIAPDESDASPDDILQFLVESSLGSFGDSIDPTTIEDTTPSPSAQPTALSSPTVSIPPTRQSSEPPAREAEMTIPSVMSLISSLTTGATTRAHPQQPPQGPQSAQTEPPPTQRQIAALPRTVCGVIALTSVFAQSAFTSFALEDTYRSLAIRVFNSLVAICSSSTSTKARLCALQFLMRLRVDRDHRLYYASTNYDEDSNVRSLCVHIHRHGNPQHHVDLRSAEEHDFRPAQSRSLQERSGRIASRGQARPRLGEGSRSRSRAPSTRAGFSPSIPSRPVVYEFLWNFPESLPFSVIAEAGTPSEGLSSYDPEPTEGRVVLPLSSYLAKLRDIIMAEKEWEVLSYVLCHLPTQLSNKHLFCGPKSKLVIANLLTGLCSSISEGRLGANIGQWPDGVLPRDAQSLAYHALTVLISYKKCFMDPQLQHRLVEVFLSGLSGQPSTIKTCLHGLSLSAFELQPSMKKYLSRILEKLSQIMSNPAMAVHIIDFLSIVGSLRTLHVNFTDADYKMVFGVALQYLQHHNRADGSVGISWALSQHVRIMSYYIVYVWFLAVKLPDRSRHVRFITRQLLLANEGKAEIDEPTEVCFDWLARYTYASADPRPANSMLNDIIMDPETAGVPLETTLAQKTWIYGNSVVTIRALARRGWVEVLSRRASGLTKFLCRAENVPLVTPGDVDPDILSISASSVLSRNTGGVPNDLGTEQKNSSDEIARDASQRSAPDRPDPITGYVWSGTAPSQRRKEVSIDPSYFALQLSSYPDSNPVAAGRFIVDPAKAPQFFRTLDRMPVIDTHKVGIMYVAPGQTTEQEILRNTHGSPAYNRFLEGLGRLINLRGQLDVYAGGLDPDEDGEYAYAWWDDIGQVLYHTATLMPSDHDESSTNKKRHIGNDYTRIVWNDSGAPYRFDTLSTQFQFVNIVIEPHSRGAIAAFSNNVHENEYFKVTVQRAPDMTEFTPIGDFKLISAEQLPLLVRQLSLLSDWFVSVFQHTQHDTVKTEMITNWRSRLQAIKRFKGQVVIPKTAEHEEGIVGQEVYRDFTTAY